MEDIKRARADAEHFIAMADMMKRVMQMTEESTSVKLIGEGIDFVDKRVHMYTGIDYLAYVLGAETREEVFKVQDVKMKKLFEYAGWTFFELSENDGEGGYYYR